MRLSDGKKFESEDNEWLNYAQKIPSGSVVSMTLDGETLSFKVNDHDLGVAFHDKRLSSNRIYPCVFIVDVNESVTALKGSTT